MKGYIAVGHGVTPAGLLDPGAVHGAVHEYDLAFHVCQAYAWCMAVSGWDFDIETAGGPGHDPNFVGSIRRVNAGRYAWACEVHFDYDKAPRGGMGLYVSADGAAWADAVAGGYRQRHAPLRSNQRRPDLGFLRGTHCPALLWECDRVGTDVTAGQLTDYGVALAIGTDHWLRSRGHAPGRG